jgi:hypothetical protein
MFARISRVIALTLALSFLGSTGVMATTASADTGSTGTTSTGTMQPADRSWCC